MILNKYIGKIIRDAGLILFSAIVFCFFVEILLYFSWKATNSTKLDTLYGNDLHWPKWELKNTVYPAHSEAKDMIKIAVFGGSSAAGSISERTFSFYMRQELVKIFGSHKVYVRNYAGNGDAFHKEQARFAKSAAPYYDILVIYAGHNEWVNPYFANGGIKLYNVVERRNIEHVRNQIQSDIIAEFNPRLLSLHTPYKYSRIYAILSKLFYKISAWTNTGRDPGGYLKQHKVVRPMANEPEKIFPQATIDGLHIPFKHDLQKIGHIVKRNDGVAIVIPGASNEFWPPSFSKIPKQLSGIDKKRIENNLAAAEKLYNAGDSRSARKILFEMLNLAPRHAFAHYLLGMSYFQEGQYKLAWRHLETAVDEDGFPMRALSSVKRSAYDADKKSSSIISINHTDTVRKLIEGGVPVELLIPDWLHPSLLNHVLIGRSVLCQLSMIEKYSRIPRRKYCSAVDPDRAEDIYRKIMNSMGVTQSQTAHEMNNYLQYGMLMARLTAHPDAYYVFVEKEVLPKVFFNRGANNSQSVKYLVYKSILWSLQGNDCHTVKQLLDKSLSIDNGLTKTIIDNNFDFTSYYNFKQILNHVGISLEYPNDARVVRCLK